MTAPGIIQDQKDHAAATAVHSATAAATPNRIILLDANGRAKIASPAVAGDIANKGYVDGVAGAITFCSHCSHCSYCAAPSYCSYCNAPSYCTYCEYCVLPGVEGCNCN